HDVNSFTIGISASDGRGGVATQSFVLAISATAPANHAPTISSSPRLTIAQGQTYVYEVQATDPDNDPLTYTLPTKPTGMTMPFPGVITWTPTASQFGNNSVQLQVSDGR